MLVCWLQVLCQASKARLVCWEFRQEKKCKVVWLEWMRLVLGFWLGCCSWQQEGKVCAGFLNQPQNEVLLLVLWQGFGALFWQEKIPMARWVFFLVMLVAGKSCFLMLFAVASVVSRILPSFWRYMPSERFLMSELTKGFSAVGCHDIVFQAWPRMWSFCLWYGLAGWMLAYAVFCCFYFAMWQKKNGGKVLL